MDSLLPVVDPFEDHCWRDVFSPQDLELYGHYKRELFIGPKVAILAVDLYESPYRGGPGLISEITKQFPASCGDYAWNAIPPTLALLDAARRLSLPIFFSTNAPSGAAPGTRATNRKICTTYPDDYEIRPEFGPQGADIVFGKKRASAFFGTDLRVQLLARAVDTVIVAGESTSGCVRASVVDGYSHGFHMVIAEECCFDRCELSHKVNLFDLHHKYADVFHAPEIVRELAKRNADHVGGTK